MIQAIEARLGAKMARLYSKGDRWAIGQTRSTVARARREWQRRLDKANAELTQLTAKRSDFLKEMASNGHQLIASNQSMQQVCGRGIKVQKGPAQVYNDRHSAGSSIPLYTDLVSRTRLCEIRIDNLKELQEKGG